MDHAIQQKIALNDFDDTYQVPGSRHLLQNRQLHTEPVTQHHQMYRNYTVQQPSTSNTMVPQYAHTHREETSQQHFNERQVHQDVGAPPLLTTHDHASVIRNKTCKTKCDLPAHDDGKGGKKQRICEFCQKVFDRGSKLKRHLLIHTQEKPYVCKLCNHRFNQKENLERHKLTRTCLKSYVCPICKHAFVRKYMLTQHLLTHTGEKKFICEICKKCFTSEKYRNWHSKNRVCMRKKANKNAEVANKQVVPNPELDLNNQGICKEQQRPLLQPTKDVAQTFSDHCGTTATGSKNYQEQAIITTLGSTENTQSFFPIDQPLEHMVPQFFNFDARRRHLIKTVEQQNISHSVPHVLRHIGHQTSAQIDNNSLAFLRPEVDTTNHTLTLKVNQNLNIGAQSLTQLISVDQQDVADLGYHDLAQMGHRTQDQIGLPPFSCFRRPNIY